MFVGDFVCGVERREKVAVFIEMAQRARAVVAGVGHQFHLVVFIAHSGIYAQFANGYGGSEISGPHSVVSLIVVSHVRLFQQIQLVLSEVVTVAQQCR